MTTVTPPLDLLEELTERNAAFERATPLEIVDWTLRRFAGDVALACSFEDLALVHMVHQRARETEIIFLDTGGHFPETLEFVNRIASEWELHLTRTQPGAHAGEWPCGTKRCCEVRKVEPLALALSGRAAWLSSVKRVDAVTRSEMKIVMWDDKFGLVKVNPLATWSDEDVAYYLKENDLDEHPLWAQGYASIGCAAMTVKPLDPGDRRSGRWVGLDKDECGLHEA